MIDMFRRWFLIYLDLLASGTSAFLKQYFHGRSLHFLEQTDGSFLLEQGFPQNISETFRLSGGSISGGDTRKNIRLLKNAEVTLECLPERFLFRPVEFPVKAAPFLGKMLNAQIDRLTPWPEDGCVFGWSPPDIIDDKLQIILAATPRAPMLALGSQIQNFGVSGIIITTRLQDKTVIKIVEINAAVQTSIHLRRIFATIIGGMFFLVAAFALFSGYAGTYYETERGRVQAEIAKARKNTQGSGIQPVDAGQIAIASLEARKNAHPAVVVMMEELSKLLPDNTYLTDLHVEGDILRLIGFSADAPALVPQLEKSLLFSDAHFYAPTTHVANDQLDHFELELKSRPLDGTPK